MGTIRARSQLGNPSTWRLAIERTDPPSWHRELFRGPGSSLPIDYLRGKSYNGLWRVAFAFPLSLPSRNDLNAPQGGLRALATVKAGERECVKFVS